MSTRRAGAVVAGIGALGAMSARALPPGFQDDLLVDDWQQAVGIAFAMVGDPPAPRMYVWEKPGRVWIVENGAKVGPPVLDISDEVGNWRDHGLLGCAFDPDFAHNGYIYLLYVVDYHHLMHFGTAEYDPAKDEYFKDTIGRLTRYTCRLEDGLRSADPASRTILIGAGASSGFPICNQSHGVGTLLFGEDGTLLASCGESAWYGAFDVGGNAPGSSNTALADGIIRPKENVGAFRAQLVDCLGGKILRLDPATGAGVPSNPYYDPADPMSARSRVFALGLRNPFRFSLRPGSGVPHPELGDPGTLCIGDVGWGAWEELSVCTEGGQNFGWPLFEGLTIQGGYTNLSPLNLDAPNPLFGQGGCTQTHFKFRNLLIQDTLDPNARFPNPCNASEVVPADIPHWIHRRPVIDWGHSGPSRTGIYNGFNAAVINIGEPTSPVQGPQFIGQTSVAGVWYTGTDFPAAYRDTYFHADFARGWMRNIVFGDDERPVLVRDFMPDASMQIVCMATDPALGGLYYIDYDEFGGSYLHRISYTGANNRPPVAVAAADPPFGPTPLEISADGSASSDPENDALTFDWDFGDGSAHGTGPGVTHAYASAGGPVCRTITLTVSDTAGNVSTDTVTVSLDNTPPVVTITSPTDGELYRLGADVTVPLDAEVSDAEHGAAQLECAWQVVLHHDSHAHPEAPMAGCDGQAVITPIGCDGHEYSYELRLSVTDGACLTTTRSVFLFPNCCLPDFTNDGFVTGDDFDAFVGAFEAGDPSADVDLDGFVSGDDFDGFVAAFEAGC